MPQLAAHPLVSSAAMSVVDAMPSVASLSSSSSSSCSPSSGCCGGGRGGGGATVGVGSAGAGSGLMTGNSKTIPKILDPQSLEALLGYARLLFAQPHGGKLSVLGCAGNKMHTITSWDPGQQTLESIMKGFSQWKFSEQEFATLDFQFAIQKSVQALFQPPGEDNEDEKHKLKNNLVGDLQETIALPSKPVSELWKAAQMARARLVVIMAPNWGAGDSAAIFHKMVLSALIKTDTRSSRVECVDLLVFDVSISDSHSNTCICMQDSAAGIFLSTSFYNLTPGCTSDLLLDLAYLHLELCAIAVKGLAAPASKQHVDESSGSVSTLAKPENEWSLDFILSTDSDLRLVLYQSMSSGPTG
jgi:hypothetical protein